MRKTINELADKQTENTLIAIASTINDLQETAEKHDWGQRYIDALEDVRKQLGLKDPFYGLFTNRGQ